jgi:GDP-4-dehydro-6-deoxy-D-mannose reductase
VSLREVIAALMAAAGVVARIEQDAARMRKAEQRRMLGSYAKLGAATGWKPEFTLDRSTHDIVNQLLKGEST